MTLLSSRILVISRVKAAGSSTNALASASGLSRTMAISISPPSFWMRAGRPACICERIATALLSYRVRSHSSRALCAKVEDEGTVRQREGGQVSDSGYCTANVTIFDFIRREDFCPMAGSESAQSCRSVYPVFGSMYFRFHTAL